MAGLKKQRLDCIIRFQPIFGTPEERVITYLRNHQLSSTSTLAMQAIRPYWLPLVVLEDNTIPLSVKQQLGRDAVRELLLHIDYTCSSLGLEYCSRSQPAKPSEVKSEIHANFSPSPDKLVGDGEWGSLGSFCE
jgi:hypothetical protein